MDNLAAQGFDVYALDFLGYGNSDRYPAMRDASSQGQPLGTGIEVSLDVDNAVNEILRRTRSSAVYIIAHSWGASVASYYTTQFPAKVAKLVLFAGITEASQPSRTSDSIRESYNCLTPEQRITLMKNLTPKGQKCRLEDEVETVWGKVWLESDQFASTRIPPQVCFPAGPNVDLNQFQEGYSYFDPAKIVVPTLLIRGEWDKFPSNNDAMLLLKNMIHAQRKKLITIPQGTHVMHLEKSRFMLYKATVQFLQ